MASTHPSADTLSEINAFRIPRLELNNYQAPPFDFGQSTVPPVLKTPAEYFSFKYPEEAKRYGCPFLEHRQPLVNGFDAVTPLDINLDFFAGVLGGRKDLGHHVVYYECETQWFFKDADGAYKPTTAEKLENLYRALLMKCAQEMSGEIQLLNLFSHFRSDRVAKQVTVRAKSILAADTSFFNATSPHARIRGVELHERLARKFVDELLMSEPGQILKLADAYKFFCDLVKKRELPPIKRSDFKAFVGPLITEQFNVALRNDLCADDKQGVRGWKGVKLAHALPG